MHKSETEYLLKIKEPSKLTNDLYMAIEGSIVPLNNKQEGFIEVLEPNYNTIEINREINLNLLAASLTENNLMDSDIISDNEVEIFQNIRQLLENNKIFGSEAPKYDKIFQYLDMKINQNSERSKVIKNAN